MIKKSGVIYTMVVLAGLGFAQQTDSKSKAKVLADVAWARAGCGPDADRFDVNMDKNQHLLAEPESGKALVYVFEEDESRGGLPTTRVGLDGNWIGGDGPESYMFFSLTPGARRFCFNRE